MASPARFIGRGGTTQLITGQPQPLRNLTAPFGGRFGGTPFTPGAGLGNIDPMVARAILGDQLGVRSAIAGEIAPMVTEDNQAVLSALVAQGAPIGVLNKIPASGLPEDGGTNRLNRLRQLLGL